MFVWVKKNIKTLVCFKYEFKIELLVRPYKLLQQVYWTNLINVAYV